MEEPHLTAEATEEELTPNTAEDPFAEDDLSEEAHDDSVRAVASSMVSAWGYDRLNEQIEISFQNGRQESYPCTPEQWEAAKEAVSPGRFVHENFL